MRVLLCTSYLGQRSGEPLVFPLGLAYLGALVKDSHEVLLWDPNVSEDPMRELASVMEKFDPDVVGVSLRNIDSIFSFNKRSYYPPFVAMIRMIRGKTQSCKLIVGGGGFSLFAEEIMARNPEIDFGIVSEGEHSFAQLLENPERPDTVKNLVFRRGDKIVSTQRGFDDFSLLPVPARNIGDLGKYKNSLYSMGVQSKRGCPFNCAFCPSTFLVGNSCRLRSPKVVVDEIEELTDDYGFSSFFFVDSTFNYPFDHARKICEEMVRRRLGLQWTAEFRPDFINESFMREAVKSGCSLFSFSPDGASDRAMQMLGKNFGVKEVERTSDLASEIDNANVGYSFLYDLPYYNREHALGLMRLVPRIMSRCGPKLRFVSLTRIRIYPHTLVHKIALEQGKIGQDTDLLYPIHYVSGSSTSMASLVPCFLRDSCILFNRLTKSFGKA
jgi:radical SAM superfamily enzyme YgiQ (UPF0313 family)